MITEERVLPLVSAAMTFWVTRLEFLGCTDPYSVSYTGEQSDNKSGFVSDVSEKEKIEKAIIFAKQQIPKISKILNKKNIIIENLDYKELIKKYNGLEYTDTYNERHQPNEILKSKNKLWYFDPPYHPSTLYAGNEAPYEDSFSWGDSREIVEILANKHINVYGELEYFIKSDYDPKFVCKQFAENLEITKKKLERLMQTHPNKWTDEMMDKYNKLFGSSEEFVEMEEVDNKESDNNIPNRINRMLNYCIRMKQQMAYSLLAYHDFDILEENNIRPIIKKVRHINGKRPGGIPKKVKIVNIHKVKIPTYYKECLGSFAKGISDNDTGEKLKGMEFVWCRGNFMPTKEMIKLKKWYTE